MISLVNPVDIEQVLRPTVYLPPGVALRVLGNSDSAAGAERLERVVAIPLARDDRPTNAGELLNK